jgi:hypothetical protein
MTLLKTIAFAAALASAAASISAAEAADAIGKVAAFKGFPKASGTGGARELAKGSELYAGDTVIASGGGNVQIILNDGTRLIVGPASRLVIETYLLRNEKTASKVAVKALRGYFRFITGSSAKSAYAISTPSATIGIRGTGFDIRVRNLTLAAVTDGTIRLRGINQQTVNAAAGCGVAEAGGGGTSAKLLEGRAKANRLRQDFPMLFSQGSFLAEFRLENQTCKNAVAASSSSTGQGGDNDLEPPPPRQPRPPQGDDNPDGGSTDGPGPRGE